MDNMRQPVMTIFGDGSKQWLLDNLLHRTDGPAIEYPDGHNSWYLNGIFYINIEQWLKANTTLTGEKK